MTENIGYKLRRLREDNNMSVSDISSQSGVHPSQIESIEKGELIPSVATLVKLSRSLGVRLGTFLDGMESTEPAVTQNGSQAPRPTINLAEGKGSDMEHLKFYALAQNKADRNMEPFIVNVEYTVPDAKPSNHEGEEFLYVLNGDVELVRSGKISAAPGRQHLFRLDRSPQSVEHGARRQSQDTGRSLHSVLIRWLS